MAKIVDYPRASLESGLQLAEAVASLGGSSTTEMAADKLGRKVSGAFAAIVSAAVKYGLISSKDGRLSVLPLHRSIKLAYSDEERRKYLGEALLSPPLFKAIADRFEGRSLPTEHFEKLLIREFDVPEDMASRVSLYFMQGCKQAGFLTSSGEFSTNELGSSRDDESAEGDEGLSVESSGGLSSPAVRASTPQMTPSPEEFSICFRGPGLESTIVVREEDDLLIVGAMLRKVERALKEKKAIDD